MKKREFKEKFNELFTSTVDDCDATIKLKLINDYLHEIEKNIAYEITNKNKSWSDEELRIVLSFPPTKENCLRLAKAFKRGYGSIELIYRWAASSNATVEQKNRDEDAFITQVRKIAKELGWRA